MTDPRFRARAARGALLVCAVLWPLLSGCTLVNRVFHRGGRTSLACHERPFAGNADSRPPLKVPEGLSAPDTRNAVKIPTLSAPERARARTEPCLAQPPNFFAKPLPGATGKPVAPTRRPPPTDTTPPPAAPATPPPATPPPAPPAPAPASVPPPDAAPSGDVAPPG